MDELYNIFKQELWSLRSFGDPIDETWEEVKKILGTYDEEGNTITLEYLIKKYKAYLMYKDSLQKTYTKEDKTIYSIKRWIVSGEYKQNYKKYTPINQERDQYLYGI